MDRYEAVQSDPAFASIREIASFHAFVFELATARAPKDGELSALLSAYEDHRQRYQTDPEAARQLIAIGETPPDESLDAVELGAWTMVANLVLNLDEVITKG